jgi:hypothetical protein
VTVIRDTTLPYVVPQLEGTFVENGITKTYDLSLTVSGFAERGAVVEVCTQNILGDEVCDTIPLSGTGEFRTFVDLVPLSANEITVRSTDAAGNTVTRQYAVTQTLRPVETVEGPGLSVFAMFGVAIAALGVGAYMLMFSRRGRGGAPVEMAAPYYAPGTENIPPPPPDMMGETSAIPPPDQSLGSTEVGDRSMTMASTEATVAPDAEVPAAPSRSRPMRRRPSASGEGGAEGSSLTGMGAEDEAMPGESHQDVDENKEG